MKERFHTPSTMGSNELRVIVIGGGLGGLATALALQRKGISVIIYERDVRLSDRRQGYGLTLTNNSKGPLAQLGLLEKCVSDDCKSFCHWIFTPAGDILGYYGRWFKKQLVKEDCEDSTGERGNLRIPREDFRRMLLEALEPSSIKWSKKLVRIKEYSEKVEVEFDDGSSDSADVVVGADGIRSVVRLFRDDLLSSQQCQKKKLCNLSSENIPLIPNGSSDKIDCQQVDLSEVMNDAKRRKVDVLNYLGITVILGISTYQHPLLNEQGFYVLDGTHRLFTMPFRRSVKSEETSDGESKPPQTMWQLSFSGLDERSAMTLRYSTESDILAEALRRTAGWLDPVQGMINSTIPGETWATGLFDREPMQQWPKGRGSGSRVTVVGDACHPMSMFKGQGANQAMEDGPLLARWLSHNSGQVKPDGVGDCGNCVSEETLEASINGGEGPLGQGRRRGRMDRTTLLTRLRCFEREMIARTTPKVLASRQAATDLHSVAVMETVFGIEGLPGLGSRSILARLRDSGVTGAAAADLEVRVFDCLKSCFKEASQT